MGTQTSKLPHLSTITSPRRGGKQRHVKSINISEYNKQDMILLDQSKIFSNISLNQQFEQSPKYQYDRDRNKHPI